MDDGINRQYKLPASKRIVLVLIAMSITVLIFVLNGMIQSDKHVKEAAQSLFLLVFFWAMIVVAFIFLATAAYPCIYEAVKRRKKSDGCT